MLQKLEFGARGLGSASGHLTGPQPLEKSFRDTRFSKSSVPKKALGTRDLPTPAFRKGLQNHRILQPQRSEISSGDARFANPSVPKKPPGTRDSQISASRKKLQKREIFPQLPKQKKLGKFLKIEQLLRQSWFHIYGLHVIVGSLILVPIFCVQFFKIDALL